MFNNNEEDIDIPDGDIEYGRMLYKDLCAGYGWLDSDVIILSDMVPA